MEIQELRKKLKPLGFKLRMETFSFGKHATLLKEDRALTYNAMTWETLDFWKPGIEVCRASSPVTCGSEKVYGLAFGSDIIKLNKETPNGKNT